MGCSAKSAATNKLEPTRPVAHVSSRNSRIALMACSRMLVKWCPAGFNPKSEKSRACDIQVSGCQFACSVEVRAHLRVWVVSPWRR